MMGSIEANAPRLRACIVRKNDELLELCYAKYTLEMTKPSQPSDGSWAAADAAAASAQTVANHAMASFQAGVTTLLALEASAFKLIEHLVQKEQTHGEETEGEGNGAGRPTAA